MFLHDVNYEKFDIAHGDTLTDPQHWDDEPFEAIVSNPPYSIKWDGRREPAADQRPALRARRRARAEVEGRPRLHDAHAELARGQRHGRDRRVPRRALPRRRRAEDPQVPVDNNYVDTVIQLPPDLFFGTTIATCIIVLKKSQGRQRRCSSSTRRPSSSRQGNKNKLTDANQQKILDAFTAREDVDHFATLVDERRRSPRTTTTSRSRPTSRPRTPARPSTSPRSTPRSRGSSRARPSSAPQIDAIVADLEGGSA